MNEYEEKSIQRILAERLSFTKQRGVQCINNWLNKINYTKPIGYYFDPEERFIEFYTTEPEILFGEKCGYNTLEDFEDTLWGSDEDWIDKVAEPWTVQVVTINKPEDEPWENTSETHNLTKRHIEKSIAEWLNKIGYTKYVMYSLDPEEKTIALYTTDIKTLCGRKHKNIAELEDMLYEEYDGLDEELCEAWDVEVWEASKFINI